MAWETINSGSTLLSTSLYLYIIYSHQEFTHHTTLSQSQNYICLTFDLTGLMRDIATSYDDERLLCFR